MIAGMGALLDLCPQPEELTLGDLTLPYGILPSQIKDQDDWEFLIRYQNLKNLGEAFQLWKSTQGASMDMKLIQYMLTLIEEVEKLWPEKKLVL